MYSNRPMIYPFGNPCIYMSSTTKTKVCKFYLLEKNKKKQLIEHGRYLYQKKKKNMEDTCLKEDT